MLFPRAALAIALVAPLVASAATGANVTGSYNSNWNNVQLTQDGDRVRGTYVCCGGGTIEGRIIEGRVIRYRWKQPHGSGMGVWTIESDGRLAGTWGWDQDDDDGGRWDLHVKREIARQ